MELPPPTAPPRPAPYDDLVGDDEPCDDEPRPGDAADGDGDILPAEIVLDPTGPIEIPDVVRDDLTAFVLGGSGGLRRLSFGAAQTWLGITVVLGLVAVPLRGLYRFTGGTMEEGFMLYFPERIRRGDVPNVDFLHLYGPGSLHVLLGWYELFGYSLVAERTFGLLQHVAIILALFTLARPWGRLAATAVGALAVVYVMTPIGLTAMAWNGGLALTLWALVFAIRGMHLDDPPRQRRAWLIAGFLGGFALTYRPDLVLALGLGLGWVMLRRPAARYNVLTGGAVGLIPMWVHLIMAGPEAAWRGMVTDPVLELRAGRELPRPPSWDVLDGALQGVAEEVPPWWRFPHLSASHSLYLWFCVMVGGTIALVLFGLWRRRRSQVATGRSAVVLGVALVSVGILPQALQRPDSAHLLWVTCVSWPFAVVVVMEVASRVRPHVSARRALAVGGAFALFITFTFTALFTFRYYLLHTRIGLNQVPSPFAVTRDDRRFYLGDFEAYLAVQSAVYRLDSLAKPGERLFVGPLDLRRTWYSDAFVYWLFPELDPATYFIEMDPGVANAEGSRLAADVASADWIVLTGLWSGWYEPNTSIEFGSNAPNRVIRTQFCEVGSWQDDLAVLYRRCP
ncbi:MAG: hypothetical protein H0U21_06135 [Acidimicrobiia bacterium]|nr:hypothetical protein [Acidimicrobiia bacterium]